MLDLAREILQTLSHNKLRTALTGIAVAWGIFMLIVLLGTSRGLSNNMQRNNSMERSSFLSIWSGRTSVPHKGYKEGRFIELDKDDLGAITDKGGAHVVEAMGNVYMGDARISSSHEYISGSIDGVYPGAATRENVKITDGRFINELDLRERRKVLVLNEDNARILFGSADSAVGRRVNCLGLSWTVVGVFADSWNRDSYAPFSTVMMLKGNTGRLYQINVKLSDMHDMADVAQVEKDVRGVMARCHEFAEDDESAVYIWNRFENYLAQQTASSILEIVVWVIGLLTMLSGIIGVSNIMFVSVRERTHEIGIRRAIGAKPGNILVQVLAESVAIMAIFGYVGVFFGILVTEVIDMFFGHSDIIYNPRVDISVAIEVTVVLIVVGALAGLFPAIKATKVKPVEALRDE